MNGRSCSPASLIQLALAGLLALSISGAVVAEDDNESGAPPPANDQVVQALQAENLALRRELKRLEGQVAGDAAIDADNRELRYEMIRLRTERARLRQENDELKSLRFRTKWGGAIFIAGLVFGYVIAIRRARRRFDREMGRL